MAKETKLSQRGIGDLQRSLERFENYNDGFILPDTFIVVRLDAHRYGDWSSFPDEYPCGATATKAFLATARTLMSATFRVVLSYVHGDEISLLVDPSENSNPLRRSKLLSAFSSAAAVHFPQFTGVNALFDAKVSELPSIERVIEYFFWQRRYCFRNASTIALRRALLASGLSKEQADAKIHGSTEEQRVALLKAQGMALETIPSTTRRGSLLSWETQHHEGREHLRVRIEMKLPDDDEAALTLIRERVHEALGIKTSQASLANKSTSPVVAKSPQPVKQKQQQQTGRSHVPPRNRKTQVSVFKVPSKN